MFLTCVNPQLATLVHYALCMASITANVNAFDEFEAAKKALVEEPVDEDTADIEADPLQFHQARLCAPQKAQYLHLIEVAHEDDLAFRRFVPRLQSYATDWLNLQGILPDGQSAPIDSTTLVRLVHDIIRKR